MPHLAMPFSLLTLTLLASLPIHASAMGDVPPANSAAAPVVTDTYWKLVELNGGAVTLQANQREPHLLMQSTDKRLAGYSGCNRLMGSYQIDGTTITFGQMASTRMACMHGMELEAAFTQALGKVRAFSVQGDALTLRDEAGSALARFIAVDLK